MPYILGIRFQAVGKVYHFDASQFPDLKPGDFAVVETSRGVQLGQVMQVVENPQRPPEGSWRPVQRKATPQDLVLRQIWQRQEAEAIIACREKAREMNLVGVKFISAECSFDGKRLSFLYSIEEGEKLDLSALKRGLQRLYPQMQVEMHQVGPRDVAKTLGGMGACGLACRCCSAFLTDFSPVSIKMAKEQGISLTPTEITGMCGRLRCCLIYEYEQYAEARKHLPKRNKRVVTPQGNGRVLDVLPLQDAVIVELDSGARHTFQRAEIEPWDELAALRQKAEAPCEKKKVVEEEAEEAELSASPDSAPAVSTPPSEEAPPLAEPPAPPQPSPQRTHPRRFRRPGKPPQAASHPENHKPPAMGQPSRKDQRPPRRHSKPKTHSTPGGNRSPQSNKPS